MSDKPQAPSGNREANSAPAHHGVFYYLFHSISILAWIIGSILVAAHLAKGVNTETVANPSMFSIPSEIMIRFDECNYHYIFHCDLKPHVAECFSEHSDEHEQDVCIENVVSPPLGTPAEPVPYWRSFTVVKLVLYSAVMLPRMPDSLINMLERRRDKGQLEFALGITFTLAYATLILFTLTSKSSTKFWDFLLAVVYGPYLILAVYWVLQRSLLGASAGAIKAAAVVTSIIGTTLCALFSTWHEVDLLKEILDAIFKRIKA